MPFCKDFLGTDFEQKIPAEAGESKGVFFKKSSQDLRAKRQ
jgi:hypothetical protein